ARRAARRQRGPRALSGRDRGAAPPRHLRPARRPIRRARSRAYQSRAPLTRPALRKGGASAIIAAGDIAPLSRYGTCVLLVAMQTTLLQLAAIGATSWLTATSLVAATFNVPAALSGTEHRVVTQAAAKSS